MSQSTELVIVNKDQFHADLKEARTQTFVPIKHPHLKHVILDMDETLLTGDGFRKIHARPGLPLFLHFCFTNFDTVSIWTAASRDWLNLALHLILNPCLPKGCSFYLKWSGERCVRVPDYHAIENGEYYVRTRNIKSLKKVWSRGSNRNLPLSALEEQNERQPTARLTRENTIIIDDTPSTFERNKGNAIQIPEFNGSIADSWLQSLAEYLSSTIIHSSHKYGRSNIFDFSSSSTLELNLLKLYNF